MIRLWLVGYISESLSAQRAAGPRRRNPAARMVYPENNK